ncbi:ORF 16 [Haloarcula hispanica virus SH1]|uniref:ORF 16 n=1 Tax=Haloarcula hispanica SH1 virus TaxID=326574 RepID=Q4KPH1_9VIRU|nr:ORF 16 [Haloarcula hispanica virus SH1]AAY24942.1 ORF 16 [Haloarcula hispanica virus SH1]
MPDEVPDDLAATIRDEEPDEWIPVAGPLSWEQRTQGSEGTYTNGREAFDALAVRDTFNDEAFIISTLYCPDLMAML